MRTIFPDATPAIAAPRVPSWRERLTAVHRWKPVRFVVVGGVCGVTQIGLLIALTELAGLGDSANLIAAIFAAQMNFLLNYVVTWGHRRISLQRRVLAQLIGFNLLVLASAGFNQVVYVILEGPLPYVAAGVLGILATTAVKYLAAARIIFRHAPANQAGKARPT